MIQRNESSIVRNNRWLAIAALVALGYALVQIAVEYLA